MMACRLSFRAREGPRATAASPSWASITMRMPACLLFSGLDWAVQQQVTLHSSSEGRSTAVVDASQLCFKPMTNRQMVGLPPVWDVPGQGAPVTSVLASIRCTWMDAQKHCGTNKEHTTLREGECKSSGQRKHSPSQQRATLGAECPQDPHSLCWALQSGNTVRWCLSALRGGRSEVQGWGFPCSGM